MRKKRLLKFRENKFTSFTIKLIVLGLLFINKSCQNNDVIDSKINESNISHSLKKINNFTFDNTLKNGYLTKIKPNQNILKTKIESVFGGSFNIKMNNVFGKNNCYQGIKVFENLSLPNNFTNTSLLIKFPYVFENKEVNLGFLIRTIEKKEKKVTEIISVLTGRVISYTLEEVSESEYSKLKKMYANTQRKSVQEDDPDPTICFTTFKACHQEISDGNGSELDQALCDFIPCNTIAYLTCQFLELEGQIENSCNFKGCNYCDVIIGQKNNDGLTTPVEPIDINPDDYNETLKCSQVVRVETKPKNRVDILGTIVFPKYIYLSKEDIDWISDTEHKLGTNLPPRITGYKYYKKREEIKMVDTVESCDVEKVMNKFISPDVLIITSINSGF